MSNRKFFKDAVSRLRAAFADVRLSLSQFEDEDGNVYQYSVLEVGADVYKAGSEGSEPAPNGEYKINDTTSIVVEDGKIAEIKEEELEEAPASSDVEDASEEVASDFGKRLRTKLQDGEMEEFFEELIAGQEILVAKVEELEAEIDALEGDVEEVEKKAEDAVVAAEEAEKAVETIEEGFHKFSKTNAGSKLNLSVIESQFNPNGASNAAKLQSYFSKGK